MVTETTQTTWNAETTPQIDLHNLNGLNPR